MKNPYLSKLYTYPCAGTDGHTEYLRIYINVIDGLITTGYQPLCYPFRNTLFVIILG
ncbi:MAG: hypothetical protein KAT65_24515 [Methanophagales archaeon]|nr:hypothetical protein [Methanophagales archaeon]